MSKSEDVPKFFKAVQELAMEHEVVTYVLVAVLPHNGQKFAVGTSAASRLPDNEAISAALYNSMRRASETAFHQIAKDERPDLVN